MFWRMGKGEALTLQIFVSFRYTDDENNKAMIG
jgi:hypothetical protein